MTASDFGNDPSHDLVLGGFEGSKMQHDDDAHHPRLMNLKDAKDLQVADGDTDIRGWAIQSADGQKVGEVEDLIVDTTLMTVRYIDGKLAHDDSSSGEPRNVLIPIALAQLDETHDTVTLHESYAETIRMPSYDGKTIPADGMDVTAHHDDARFFGTRRTGRESTSYIAPMADVPTDHTGKLL